MISSEHVINASHDRTTFLKFILVAVIAILLAGLSFAGQILMAFGAVVGMTLIALLTYYPRVGLVALIFTSTSLLVPTGAYSTGLPISMSRAIGFASSIGFVFWAYNNRHKLTYAPQMNWLIVFLGAVCLSVVIMPTVSESIGGLVKILQAVLVYVLISNLAAEQRWIRVFAMSIMGTALVASSIAIAEHYLPALHVQANDPRLQEGIVGAIVDDESADSGDIARVTGGIGDANYLAYTLAAAIPMGVYFWNITSSNRVRGFIIIATILQLAGLAFSYTRTGFLGLGVATIYLLLRRRVPMVPFLFICFGAVVAAIFVMPPTFTERMFSTRYLKEGSTPVRRDLAYTAIDLAKERPIFGYGYGQFGPEFIKQLRAGKTLHELKGGSGAVMEEMIEKGYEAVNDLRCHNTYLEVLFEYGLVGLVPYLLFLGFVVRDLWQVEKYADPANSQLASALMAGLIAFFTCGFLGHAKILTIFWILAGLACALRRVVLDKNLKAPEAVA